MFRTNLLVGRVVCSLLVGLCMSSAVSADDVYWDDDGGGLFSDSANWYPVQVPGVNDVAIFELDAWTPYVVDFTGSVTNKQMIVRNDMVEFDLGGYTYTLTIDGNSLIMGENGGDYGSLLLSNGTINTHQIDLALYGGEGEITVDASASITSDSRIVVGNNGMGVLTIDGGDVRTTESSGWITAGENDYAEGYILVSNGGVLEAESAPINIGPYGHGEMEIYAGGSVISSGELFIAWSSASSSGNVFISGTDSSYVSNSVYPSVVGGAGEGYLDIFDGASMQCVNMDIGRTAGGDGTVEVDGFGSTLSTNVLNVGMAGVGELTVIDGKVLLGTVDAGLVDDGAVFLGPNGRLKGTGLVDAEVVINEQGVVSPGASPGLLTLTGEYEQRSQSFSEFHIAGTTRGSEYSALDVVGNVALAGGLMLWFEDGFLPQAGQTFDLIVSDASIMEKGNPFSVVYVYGLDPWAGDWMYSLDVVGGNILRLTSLNTVPVLAGDLNSDGYVGLDDLDIVLGAWNQSVPPGNPLADPSGDGFVGLDDLDIVLGNWNAGTPPADGAAVPEPAMVVLLALGGLVLLRR